MELLNATYQQIYDQFKTDNIAPDDVVLVLKVTDGPNAGQVCGILGSDLFPSSTAISNFQWVSTGIYDTGKPVIYANKWWISLIDANEGNIPSENENWAQVNKVTASALRKWVEGIYVEDDNYVVYDGIIYELSSEVARPYNSVDNPEIDFDSWIPLPSKILTISHSSEVKFDRDADYPIRDEENDSFTLAATGNRNGKIKTFKLNKPINLAPFSADFLIIGDALTNTDLNYITCRYDSALAKAICVNILLPAIDITIPALTNVSVDNIQGETADFNAQLSEAGTIFWAAYDTADPQHSIAEIEAGTGAVVFGNIITAGGIIETDGISGLIEVESYKVHYFGRDDADNESAAAITAEFSTILEAPTVLVAVYGTDPQTEVDLSWVDNSNVETLFLIERKEGLGGVYAQIDTVGPNITAYSDSGLTPETEYYYRVRATNGIVNSSYSNEDNITTDAAGSVPVLQTLTVEDAAPRDIVATYDVALDAASIPDVGDASLAGKTFSEVIVSGMTVIWRLAQPTVANPLWGGILFNDDLTTSFSYTAGVNPIQSDVGGNNAADLVNETITNNVVDHSAASIARLTTPPAGLQTDIQNLINRLWASGQWIETKELFLYKGMDTKVNAFTGLISHHSSDVASDIVLTGGASGSVDSITVGGVNVMSGAEAFDTDLTTTAANVAANINAHVSSPEYRAISYQAKIMLIGTPGVVVVNTTTITATSTTSKDGSVWTAAEGVEIPTSICTVTSGYNPVSEADDITDFGLGSGFGASVMTGNYYLTGLTNNATDITGLFRTTSAGVGGRIGGADFAAYDDGSNAIPDVNYYIRRNGVSREFYADDILIDTDNLGTGSFFDSEFFVGSRNNGLVMDSRTDDDPVTFWLCATGSLNATIFTALLKQFWTDRGV